MTRVKVQIPCKSVSGRQRSSSWDIGCKVAAEDNGSHQSKNVFRGKFIFSIKFVMHDFKWKVSPECVSEEAEGFCMLTIFFLFTIENASVIYGEVRIRVIWG